MKVESGVVGDTSSTGSSTGYKSDSSASTEAVGQVAKSLGFDLENVQVRVFDANMPPSSGAHKDFAGNKASTLLTLDRKIRGNNAAFLSIVQAMGSVNQRPGSIAQKVHALHTLGVQKALVQNSTAEFINEKNRLLAS